MIDAEGLTSAMESAALKLGHFDRVNKHEPKGTVANGITAAIWLQNVRPFARQSGLDATGVVVTFMIRIYTDMLSEPQDAIDPRILVAASDLMGALSAGFTLGDLVSHVDLLGQTGTALSAQAGYLDVSNKLMRIMDITVPMVINDVWTQTP